MARVVVGDGEDAGGGRQRAEVAKALPGGDAQTTGRKGLVFPGGQRAVGGGDVGRAVGEQGVGTGRVVGGDSGVLGLAVGLGRLR